VIHSDGGESRTTTSGGHSGDRRTEIDLTSELPSLKCHAASMDLRAKLQLKPGQRLDGVQVPDSVAAVLVGDPRQPVGENPVVGDHPTALLVFVADRAALEEHRERIVDAAASDRMTWVAYPKGGALGTDLNRDSLSELLETHAVRPVRQVAVDEIWSALRLRPA